MALRNAIQRYKLLARATVRYSLQFLRGGDDDAGRRARTASKPAGVSA